MLFILVRLKEVQILPFRMYRSMTFHCYVKIQIFLTGKKAFQLYEKYIDLEIEHIYLPSTSSANAKMHLDQLVESYKVILEKL